MPPFFIVTFILHLCNCQGKSRCCISVWETLHVEINGTSTLIFLIHFYIDSKSCSLFLVYFSTLISLSLNISWMLTVFKKIFTFCSISRFVHWLKLVVFIKMLLFYTYVYNAYIILVFNFMPNWIYLCYSGVMKYNLSLFDNFKLKNLLMF